MARLRLFRRAVIGSLLDDVTMARLRLFRRAVIGSRLDDVIQSASSPSSPASGLLFVLGDLMRLLDTNANRDNVVFSPISIYLFFCPSFKLENIDE